MRERAFFFWVAVGALVVPGVVLSPRAAIAQTGQSEVPSIIAPAPVDGGELPTREAPRIMPAPGETAIREILVEGTQRIEPETVISYLTLREGDAFDPQEVNESLKTLFGTGLFADVTIRREGDDLVVRVVENPIINRIAFEGNRRIDNEVLAAEVQLRPRVVYTRTRVQNDVRRILEVYRRRGRFAASVEPKVIQLEQNRVDLVFEITEGPLTGIEKISFIGNSFFSDSALRGEIQTKESRWYRFLSSADRYDPDQLTFDRELLRRFYLSKGFADFRVVSAVAELSDDRENFFVTFTVEEGERYRFGEFNVVSRIVGVDSEPLLDVIRLDPGDWYNADAVDTTVGALTDAVGELGYAFVEVRPIVDRDRDNRTISITFEIGEGPRVFVERIDIRGNIRTHDRVIRREFLLVEGDAFNSSKLRRSRQRIGDLGFFRSVNVNNVPGSAPDKTVVEVDIEEQSTGELTIGAGYSTQAGALAEFSIRERNLLGRGQDLSAAVQVAQRRQAFDIAFTEPYFLERDLSAGIDLFHVVTDQQEESSFDLARTGGGLRLGYEINESWRQQLTYQFSRDRISNVDSRASRFIRDQEGRTYRSIIGQTLTLDERNSRIDPTDGYIVSFGTDVAGLGGTVRFFRGTIKAANHISFGRDYLLTTSGEVGYIVGLGEDVRINDRFFLGGDNLRGFESAGAGPRDVRADDSLGGERIAHGTVELLFPLGLPEEFGLRGAVFSDFGTLTEVSDKGPEVADTGSIRASVGFGLAWTSPFGPIRADFSKAVVKEDHDKEEFFRFSFGTRF